MAGLPTTANYQKVATGDGTSLLNVLGNSALQSAYSKFQNGDKGMLQIDFNPKIQQNVSGIAGQMGSLAGGVQGVQVQQDASNQSRVNVGFTSTMTDANSVHQQDDHGVLSWLGDNAWVVLILIGILFLALIFLAPEIIISVIVAVGPAILTGLGILIAGWIIYKLVSSVLGSLGIPQEAMPFLLIGGLVVTALMLSGGSGKNKGGITIINQGPRPMERPDYLSYF